MKAFPQLGLYVLTLLALTYPAGSYIYRVFEGETTLLSPLLAPVEKWIYRLCGVSPESRMRWTTYAVTLLLFNVIGFAVLFLILSTQAWHPRALNPQGISGMNAALAFNTAIAFVTNTDWQAYAGEAQATYASQMFGLTWQNFVSAATSMAASAAVMRGLTCRKEPLVGNFWVDLTRSVLYILLPISVALAFVFCAEGVVQNLNPFETAQTIEGVSQTIAQGPAASQAAIKVLGTNGGGFFNANSAHPYENPTPLTNFLQMLAILILPAGLTVTFGLYAQDASQGRALLAAMLLLFLASTAAVCVFEAAGNPILSKLGADQQPYGNMEGKETRFGAGGSAIFASIATTSSCGAVNAAHDSFTPLGGLILLLNIAVGGTIFGGVGTGILGIIIFALLAVFAAGLMVGRTPEYLGKKLGAREMKMVMAAILAAAVFTLSSSGLAVSVSAGLSARKNLGPHGLTEILYATASTTGNNGSAFAGLGASGAFYNILLGISMLAGRFLFLIPLLAIAGSMSEKIPVPRSSGTFPTTGPLFICLLVGIILLTGALAFIPALTLGPIAEHFAMVAGEVF